MATATMAGALVMAITAPQAATAAPASVLLTASDGSLQPVIDQILAEMQAAVTANSALPFTSAANNALQPASVQNMEFWSLMTLLGNYSNGNSVGVFQLPEAVAGDAAEPRQMYGMDNPDTLFTGIAGLDPDATYVITGHLSPGTETVNLTAFDTSPVNFTPGPNLELGTNAVVNPDGTYTVTVGPTAPAGGGNYLDDTGFNSVTIRDTLGNWALGPDSFSVKCIAECPAADPDVTSTGLSSSAISSILNTLAKDTPISNALWMFVAKENADRPVNGFTPIEFNTTKGALATQASSFGNYDLKPDEAEIIKVPDSINSSYTGVQLGSAFYQTTPYVLTQSSLNNTQAFHDADGYTYYVVSATNPGVANWLDTAGIDKGDIQLRWQGVAPGETLPSTGVTTQVVPVADVSTYLPTDTPTVSPEQFAADMAQRVLSYDYFLDSTRTSTWVSQELWLHDLQAAMGSDNFDQVFGSEMSTPLWLRLTPALSPDTFTLVKDFLADPSAAMAAIRDNLALAEKDISLPIQLAEALLQKDPGSFLSVLNEALFDPNTGVVAGILNARDDLATAVMAATDNGFPTQLGPIATWEWQHMSELTQMTPGTMASDLSALVNPGDLLGS